MTAHLTRFFRFLLVDEQGSLIGQPCGLLQILVLPASTQRFIESDQGEQFISLRLGELEFRGEVICLICQHFKVAGCSTLISNIRKARGVLS